MISKAQINVIPSLTSTGMKVKLINALSNGKHCIVNNATIEGSDLSEICYKANTAPEFENLIRELFNTPYTSKDRENRATILAEMFNNTNNAAQQVKWIWGK